MSALERNCILYITHYKFCISHPKNLTVIDLSNNFISQEFPKALYNCSSSKTLTSHRITSTAQSRWTFTACLACAASTLEPTASLVTFHHLLDSQNNFISQEFLKAHYNCSKFEDLDLSQNNSTSTIPVDIHQFSGWIPAGVSSWRMVFEACNNLSTGTIPRKLTSLPYLTTLLLDQNQLSGVLPSDIISWKTLNTLNLH